MNLSHVHKLLVQDEVQGWHEPAIAVRAGDKLDNRRSEILDKVWKIL
jgi:hypothetical protein